MKRQAAVSAAILLCIALAACGANNNLTITDPARADEYAVYQNGELALTLEDAGGSFFYTWADQWELDCDSLHTLRGVSVGRVDDEILEAYGDAVCQVEYYADEQWFTLYDTPFSEYYDGPVYSATYNATFSTWLVNDKRVADASLFQELAHQADRIETLEVFALTFTVENGVIKEIECYKSVMP